MHDEYLRLCRRRFLGGSALSLGSIALRHLAGRDVTPRTPFAPRAKNVIYLHMEGAPPTLDMFDRKPLLDRLHDDEASRRLLSVFDLNLGGTSYQIVASISYADPLRKEPREVRGFMVDMMRVRTEYFPRVLEEMLQDPDDARRKRVFAAMLPMKKLDIAKLQQAYDQKQERR